MFFVNLISLYFFNFFIIYYHIMFNITRRKGGRQGTNGLCVVTKTNAGKTVRCESVERGRGGDCLTIFWWKLG